MTVETIQRTAAPLPRPGGVVNLDGARFESECARLLELAVRHGRPDVLVAIPTGGVFVAEAMVRATAHDIPILLITCRRASTFAKQRAVWIMRVLGRLPRSMLDRLRVVEHRILTGRQARRDGSAYAFDANELASLKAWLASAGPTPSLLVVDDAVDSGRTLSQVLAILNKLAPPDAVVRSAVITVTTAQPVADADYALYRGQLCRFPWSHDA